MKIDKYRVTVQPFKSGLNIRVSTLNPNRRINTGASHLYHVEAPSLQRAVDMAQTAVYNAIREIAVYGAALKYGADSIPERRP